jgi:Putative peptidoglycan binding domain
VESPAGTTGLRKKKELEMSTTYSTRNEPKNDTGILAAAATACIIALVAVVAVAGFAFGRHTTSAAPAPAPTPTHTTGTVTPAKPVTPTPAPSAAVETLQKQLGQLNYYEGPVDGLMGPQTIAAITYLQRDAGLPQTGTMNAATQAALANFLVNGNNQMAS